MRIKLLLLTSAVFLAGCSEAVESLSAIDGHREPEAVDRDAYFAGFEDDDTKAFVDEDLHLFWTNGDRLSIFSGNTCNRQYIFNGETGANSAKFERVDDSGDSSGSPMTSNIASYAIYPYRESTVIGVDGTISLTLPSTQNYAENSFGLEANTMVAVTKGLDDKFLSFKNVGGFITFKLYGEGTIVKSVSLTGMAEETLAGNASVTASNSATPVVSFADDGSLVSTLTIDCGEGVELGASAEEAKGFWFVVPPVAFSNGFEITFTSVDGASITKTVSRPLTVERNRLIRFATLELVFESDFVDKTELGVYSCDVANHKVSTLYRYEAGRDQYAVSSGSFRIQNLADGHLAGITLPSLTITQGNNYAASVMLFGIDGYADGAYSKTMVAEKVENDKVWLLEKDGSLGFIINTK